MSSHPSEQGGHRDELRRACAELERRLRAGEGRAEDMLSEYTAVAADPDAALELVYTEFVLRQELGQQPSPQDWYARFPQWSGDLAQLFDVHRFACASLADTREGDGRPGGPPAPGLAGRRLGAYELLEELGRGGMGVVYKARQAGLDRLVAVKLILTGDYSGPRERARFRREAEAVARLDHPNIIQVFEVGEHDGRPFFSMEYVAGGHLADRLTGTPWPCGDAAELVRTLALAVEHAHQRGIVHRDLKPANILLSVVPPLRGGAGEPASERRDYWPKVTDFGLARRLPGADRKTVPAEGRTLSGAILGSPHYMAPEQAGGDRKEITPAADVYALGSILYELLTGRPPFYGTNVLEVLEQVRSSEPPPPRRLQPKVPRDLETACLKCLHKQPERRYATAADLAEDLRRFQAGEPVAARPVGRLERAAKWVRRRPAVAAMLGVVAGLLLLMAAGVALAFQALRDEQVRTARQRDLAEQNLEQARRAEAEAKGNLEQARQAVDECFGLASDDPLLQADHLRKVRHLLLAKTLPFYQSFARRTPDDPALAARQAEYQFKVAFITQEIGSKAEALASFEQARDLYERLSAASPEAAAYRASLGRCWINVATMQNALGRLPEARASYERAVGLLARLSEEHPEKAEYRSSLAVTWDNLGLLQSKLTGPRDALPSLTRALGLWQGLTDKHPAFPRYQVGLARTHTHLGSMLGQAGQRKEALDHFEGGLALLRRLHQRHPEAPQHRLELASTLSSLAALQLRGGERAEAQKRSKEAVAILSELHTTYPDFTRYQAGLAAAWNHLGDAQSDPRDRMESVGQGLGIRKKLAEVNPDVPEYRADLALNHWRLGVLQHLAKRPQEALPNLRAAREIQERLCAAHPGSIRYRAELAASCGSLAVLLRREGQKPEALECYRRASSVLLGLTRDKAEAVGHKLNLGGTYCDSGLLLCELGRAAEGLAAFDDAARALQAVLGRRPDDARARVFLCNSHRGRAQALGQLGRHREAALDWEQAERLAAAPRRQQLRAEQALALARAGEYFEATRLAAPLAAAGPPGGALFDLARAYALAAREANPGAASPLPLRERAEGRAREAIALLGRAARAGFFRDPKKVLAARNDPAFGPIRGRDDFPRALAGE